MIRRQTHKVRVTSRARPLRLAFLVSRQDKNIYRRILETNTCIWGGFLNPIIPVYERAPGWARKERGMRLLGPEITRGYLDAFEPDYVVTEDKAIAAQLGVPDAQILSLSDVLSSSGDSHVDYGMSVTVLYRYLYAEEFRFVHKQKPLMNLPQPGGKRDELLVATLFGRFPQEQELAYFETHYRQSFDARACIVSAGNLFSLLERNKGTPLRLGASGLDLRRRRRVTLPTLFYFESSEVTDLIDFWNLRAIGYRVMPVPRKWADKLVDVCRVFVRETESARAGTAARTPPVTVLRSRATRDDDLRRFIRDLTKDHTQVSVQNSYPRLWSETHRSMDDVLRWDVSAGDTEEECTLQDGRLSFSSATPAFVTQVDTGNPQWTNVVHLRQYDPFTLSSLVLPRDFSDLDRTFETLDEKGTTRVTSEGIVVKCRYPNWRHTWKLPDTLTIMRTWFAQKKLPGELSGAGRIAYQLVRTLGSVSSSGVLADSGVVSLIQKSAGDKAVSRQEWLRVLSEANKGNAEAARRHLESLLRLGVLKVGCSVKCPECSRENWYPLGEVEYDLTCRWCLSEYPFPAATPSAAPWQYRTHGPFTVRDHVQGGLTVVLTLRFLLTPLYGEATWIPGLVLGTAQGDKLEFDIGLFWRNAHDVGAKTRLILGECKSYNRFEPKDISRCRELAKRFPGAIIVFATLNTQLNDKEKRLLSSFARVGRRRSSSGHWKTPVLILTACELFSDMGAPYCWRDAGGEFAKVTKHLRPLPSMEVLCDVTQQLHLGLASALSQVPWD